MKVDRKNLAYLALEGGGGKGVTYVGAIQSLEGMKVEGGQPILPIDINRPGENQIKGISGASAGAITALLLAMGLNSNALRAVLSQPATFTGFFDGPSPGRYRLVDSQGRSTDGGKQRLPQQPSFPSTLATTAARLYAPGTAAGLEIGAQVILDKLVGLAPPEMAPMAQKLRTAPGTYLDNLLLDRGLFPGFAPRHFFQQMMQRYLDPKILAAAGNDPSRVRGAETIGFAQFYDFTGVDLVITGVNVTKQRPAMFSRRLTPQFPVADAVAISMSLPVLFKPARVDVEVPVTSFNTDAKAYQGFWVDGGVLNNLPLHAFDVNFTDPARATSTTEALNPQVLALRLTEGAPPGTNPPEQPIDLETVGIGAFLGDFGGTLMYPSEQGQLRSAAEAEQSIDLYTYKLKTTDFAPPPEKSRQPIEEAEKSVYRYFNPGSR